MRAVVTTTALLLTVTAYGVEPKTANFRACDGHRLAADYYAPPVTRRTDAPMVILLHDARGQRQDWDQLIGPLHEAGCAVLALDLRGHGESATTATRQQATDRDPDLFRAMQHDLRGAYDWLATQPGVDRARFALIGSGLGCSVALQYAAQDRSVDVVVGLSPVLNDAGLDAAGDIHQITGRKILLIATHKQRDAAYTLQQRADKDVVEVRLVNGDAARVGPLPAVSPKTEKALIEFVEKGLGAPSQEIVYGSINSRVYHHADSGWLEKINPTNMRHYSSPAEAEARGLRASRSRGPRKPPAPERKPPRDRRRP